MKSVSKKAAKKKVAKKAAPRKKVAKKKTTRKPGGGRPIKTVWIVDGKKLTKAQVQAKICYEIAHSSMGLETIIKLNEGMPCRAQVYKWLQEDLLFIDNYAQAKEDQMDYMATEIIEIADDSRNDYIEKLTESGDVVMALDRDNIQRDRLRVDTRKWLMSKLKPKKYGEKTTTEHVTPDGEPAEYVILPVAVRKPES